MNKPFFTIIVACCDIEQYANDMIQSVSGQTFENFECLLVVEKSKDKTLELCSGAAAKDSRFKVFTQKRSGSPSAPRNTGIMHAEGKYVLFLDGDDWLPEDALEILSQAINTHDYPDVVQGAAEEWLEDINGKRVLYERRFNYRAEDHGRICSGTESILMQYREKTVNPFPIAALSVCRLDFLRDNKLFFIHGLKHEDEAWTPEMLFNASRLLVLNKVIYFYRRRAGSITTADKKVNLRAIMKVTRRRFHFCALYDVPADVLEVWQKQWLCLLFRCFFEENGTLSKYNKIRRLSVLRYWLRGQARREFRLFSQTVSLPKRIALNLILLCTASHKFRTLFPCDLYFHLAFYPLVHLRDKFRA